MVPLALDCSCDSRPLLGHLGLVGCVVVARYSHAGATDAAGNVPVRAATPLCIAEADAIRSRGMRVLMIANNIGYGDTTGLNALANGQAKAHEVIGVAVALGYPGGCLIVADLEGWEVDPDFLKGWCETISAAGYTPMLYGGPTSPWRASWEYASAQWPACACYCWTARWVGAGWTGQAPPWAPEGDGGDKCLMWQFTDRGPQRVDLSEVQPAALAPGFLWAPSAVPAQPKPGIDAAAALAELRRIAAEVAAAEKALGA